MKMYFLNFNKQIINKGNMIDNGEFFSEDT